MTLQDFVGIVFALLIFGLLVYLVWEGSENLSE